MLAVTSCLRTNDGLLLEMSLSLLFRISLRSLDAIWLRGGTKGGLCLSKLSSKSVWLITFGGEGESLVLLLWLDLRADLCDDLSLWRDFLSFLTLSISAVTSAGDSLRDDLLLDLSLLDLRSDFSTEFSFLDFRSDFSIESSRLDECLRDDFLAESFSFFFELLDRLLLFFDEECLEDLRSDLRSSLWVIGYSILYGLSTWPRGNVAGTWDVV